jgi:hypothetical protein
MIEADLSHAQGSGQCRLFGDLHSATRPKSVQLSFDMQAYAGAPDVEPITLQTGFSLFEEQDLIVCKLAVLM